MKAICRGCGTEFETDRTDTVFHDGACKARFWRTMGRTGQHAELENFKSKHCEYCGNMFWFNDYADRAGKRVPTYCRDKCRVAAHRERTKAKWTHEQTAKANPRSWEAARKRAEQNKSAPPPPPPPPGAPDFRDNLKPPSRWNEREAYEWLGVPLGSAEKVCSKAMRDLNRKYHPDKNGGATWRHLPYVNAAYDYLKRRIF